MKKKSENTKGVIRIRKAKKNRQHNGQKKKVQKDKQRSTKHNLQNQIRLLMPHVDESVLIIIM